MEEFTFAVTILRKYPVRRLVEDVSGILADADSLVEGSVWARDEFDTDDDYAFVDLVCTITVTEDDLADTDLDAETVAFNRASDALDKMLDQAGWRDTEKDAFNRVGEKMDNLLGVSGWRQRSDVELVEA